MCRQTSMSAALMRVERALAAADGLDADLGPGRHGVDADLIGVGAEVLGRGKGRRDIVRRAPRSVSSTMVSPFCTLQSWNSLRNSIASLAWLMASCMATSSTGRGTSRNSTRISPRRPTLRSGWTVRARAPDRRRARLPDGRGSGWMGRIGAEFAGLNGGSERSAARNCGRVVASAYGSRGASLSRATSPHQFLRAPQRQGSPARDTRRHHHGLEGASGHCMGGGLRLCALALGARTVPYGELVDVGRCPVGRSVHGVVSFRVP